ncbi:root phototropism protein 3-like isoform X2 [Nymphaea colorata]|nr:root phototropism protein 3-like isoform X2 [Nymphaea colorata]
MVVNFCYGAGVEITAGNVAALRCAAEFMEMTESVAEGNLVAKTESFLALVALPSWRHSFDVLRSCETLPPLAETHLIARRCCESIASKVRCSASQDGVGSARWLDDLSSLRIEHFSRVVTMVAAKGGSPEVVAVSIAKYAEKRLTGGRGTATGDSELRNSSRMGLPETENEETGTSPFHNHRFLDEMQHAQIGRRKEKEKESATLHHTGSMPGLDGFGTESVTEKRRMVESLVSLLPAGKEVIDVGLLLGMLKAAVRLGAAPALVGELEKRVGMNLEKTSAEDLVSVVSGGEDGADGVEMVQRLVEYFLMQDDREGKLAAVAKILDGYLAEIAKRPDLSPARFQVIAEALPEFARTCDDGLYRAIDTYLKAHQTLTEHERRRVCRAMNCRKLTVDARLHAARNERLPLRTVITVLHEEQVKMRGNYLLDEHLRHDVGELRGNCRCEGEVSSLRAEVEKIKEMLAEQQSYWMELQEEMGRQTRQKNGPAGGWSSGWKKIKNYSLFQGKMINGGTNDLRQKHMLGVQLSPKNDRIRRMSMS